MIRLVMVLLFAAGCVAEESDIEVTDHFRNGFGLACSFDPSLVVTPCYGDGSAAGWCTYAGSADEGVCEPKCGDPYRGGCASGTYAVFVAGNQCYCQPPALKLKPGASAR